MLRRLINDVVDQAALTSIHKAVGSPLHNIVWSKVPRYTMAPMEVDDIHDAVSNAVRNVSLNVFAAVDLTIGTKI